MSVANTIKDEEGFRPTIYKDTRGIWTLGYGFNVDPDHGGNIPRIVADFWADFEVNERREQLIRRWAPFVVQPLDVQDALVQLAYQIGVDGLLGFKLMLAALQRGDRATAAAEALNSDWQKQTPARAERVAALMRGEA